MNAKKVIETRINHLELKRESQELLLISKTRIGGDIDKTLSELEAIRLRLDEANNILGFVERGSVS